MNFFLEGGPNIIVFLFQFIFQIVRLVQIVPIEANCRDNVLPSSGREKCLGAHLCNTRSDCFCSVASRAVIPNYWLAEGAEFQAFDAVMCRYNSLLCSYATGAPFGSKTTPTLGGVGGGWVRGQEKVHSPGPVNKHRFGCFLTSVGGCRVQ